MGVVRKVIRSEATAFRYTRTSQPAPKLGPWREALDGMLLANAGKAPRERLTLIRVFEALRGLGYEGGYDAVRRYAKGWRRTRTAVTAPAFVPLVFAPGEAYQFDWSHEIVLIGGTTTRSRSPTSGSALAHDVRAGLPAREPGDGVRRPRPGVRLLPRHLPARDLRQHEDRGGDDLRRARARLQSPLLQMCSHYLVEPVACTRPRAGREGQVENQVGLVRERLFTPRVRVKSYDELNAPAA